MISTSSLNSSPDQSVKGQSYYFRAAILLSLKDSKVTLEMMQDTI